MSGEWVWLIAVSVLALPALSALWRAISRCTPLFRLFVWSCALCYCAAFWIWLALVLGWL